MLITHTMLTTASPERIWEIWTDVDNWKSWNKTLDQSQLKGVDFKANAKGFMVNKQGRKSPFKVISCDPQFSYTVTARYPFAKLNIRRFIGYDHRKTMFTHEISMNGPLGWLWWSILRKRLQSGVPQMMQNIKDLAEVQKVNNLSVAI